MVRCCLWCNYIKESLLLMRFSHFEISSVPRLSCIQRHDSFIHDMNPATNAEQSLNQDETKVSNFMKILNPKLDGCILHRGDVCCPCDQ